MTVVEVIKECHYSGIYKWVNKVNGKIYVGQSRNLSDRFSRYYRGEFNSYMKRAIEKYGFENFDIEILERNVSLHELDLLEQYWMDYYQSYHRDKGYNICPIAGNTRGTKRTQETRKKMSEAAKKKRPEQCSRYGKPIPPELKEKLIASRSTPVEQYSLTGDFIAVFPSQTAAATALNICLSSISNCCKGKRKTCGGYTGIFVKKNVTVHTVTFNFF